MFLQAIDKREEIEKAMLKTVAFFDLFDYPLTPLEIYYYLDQKIPLDEVIKRAAQLSNIETAQGFIFLPGRSELVIKRQKKYNYTQRKLKKARWFARLFSFCPFVVGIFIGNSLGAFNLRDGSDIDFVIISSPKRLWLTRLYCTGLAALLNSRPQPRNKRDKICLSFYLDSSYLNLDDLQLKPHDPYFFYWLRSLILLYNKNDVYQDFLRANNLPLREVEFEKNNKVNDFCLLCKINNFLFFLEKMAKKFQLAIMASDLKKAANNSVGVVINDKVLKLYLHDNRQEYLERYGNKLQQIFAQNN